MHAVDDDDNAIAAQQLSVQYHQHLMEIKLTLCIYSAPNKS